MNVSTEKIRKVHFRVKAEAVINTLLSSGVSFEDIIIRYKSAHSKNWGHDIIRSEKKGEKVYIDIARDGLFHSLPEYLFMMPASDTRQQPEIDAYNKQQKINANILLNPIEHAIFEKKVELEQFELDIIHQLFSSSLQPLADFYRIDSSIGPVGRAKLAKMFPFIYSITGNFALTAIMLSYLLDLKVDYTITEVQKSFQTDNLLNNSGLNESAIGDSMFLGGDFLYVVPFIQFTAGTITCDEVAAFLPGGEKYNIFDCFSKYFIPLDYDTDLSVEIDESESVFSFENAYLGFNTTTK
jgi:hypothetical protein